MIKAIPPRSETVIKNFLSQRFSNSFEVESKAPETMTTNINPAQKTGVVVTWVNFSGHTNQQAPRIKTRATGMAILSFHFLHSTQSVNPPGLVVVLVVGGIAFFEEKWIMANTII